ncbi:MAG: hypothetical protein JSW73_03260 [Candidatus Woesearchaeota archaeon]|nr:MAG: hypothetical protein JSW73_03260 [Candidatus Woesearchaeota archaeon]
MVNFKIKGYGKEKLEGIIFRDLSKLIEISKDSDNPSTDLVVKFGRTWGGKNKQTIVVSPSEGKVAYSINTPRGYNAIGFQVDNITHKSFRIFYKGKKFDFYYNPRKR